jgi:hypothetical protein
VVLLAVQHRFQDYDLWKQVFDSFPPQKGGAKFHRINRLVGDPGMVLVVAGFETVAEAQAFRANPALADAMKRSGIVGEPRIEMYEEVESIQY